MRGECCPGLLTVTIDDVDDPVGNAGFLAEFRKPHGGERCEFGGLQYQRAAGGQRRCDFQHHHRQRRVPRRDGSHDTDRFAQRERQRFAWQLALWRSRDRRSFDLGGTASVITKEIRDHHAADVLRQGCGQTVIEDLEFAQLLEVLLHEIGDLPQHGAALRRRESRPWALEGRARRAHGSVDFRGTTGRTARDAFARGGIVDVDQCAIGRMYPSAADEVAMLTRQKSQRRGGQCGGGTEGRCIHVELLLWPRIVCRTALDRATLTAHRPVSGRIKAGSGLSQPHACR